MGPFSGSKLLYRVRVSLKKHLHVVRVELEVHQQQDPEHESKFCQRTRPAQAYPACFPAVPGPLDAHNLNQVFSQSGSGITRLNKPAASWSGTTGEQAGLRLLRTLARLKHDLQKIEGSEQSPHLNLTDLDLESEGETQKPTETKY